jgi:acetyl-CoA synthetase
MTENGTFHPPQFANHSHHLDLKTYEKMYKESIETPDVFFGNLAKELLDWYTPFHTVKNGSFEHGDVNWFQGGQINVSFNCVDRHALKNPDKVAIIYEADEPGNSRKITFGELKRAIGQFANVLKKHGIRKGDRVAIYMPNIPEAAIAMLACVRIGAIHSVIFAGFSSDAVRDRILDAECPVVLTANEGIRGGRITPLKQIVDTAVSECPCVRSVIVFKRTASATQMIKGRDFWWHEEIGNQRPHCPPEHMSSEDPLFLLYTSGSTGKPKGVLHTNAGYLLGATMTCKYVFDMHSDDIHGCMADVGWITGHTYIVYGPLSNGVTTVMFESTPLYPTPSRYWYTVIYIEASS